LEPPLGSPLPLLAMAPERKEKRLDRPAGAIQGAV